MKTRDVVLASGEKFTVPQGLQRLDSGSTHGWQVRYVGTKYFADGPGGSKKSFEAALRELVRRINTLSAPVSIKRKVGARKKSDLPVGISGPNVLNKGDSKVQVAVLTVVVPKFGSTPEFRDIHIGTPTTYTEARYRDAVAKAMEVREQGVAAYERAATAARRVEARAMKKAVLATR